MTLISRANVLSSFSPTSISVSINLFCISVILKNILNVKILDVVLCVCICLCFNYFGIGLQEILLGIVVCSEV